MSDAHALDWLDRLLAADEQRRSELLAALAHDDPPLHARLERLLASALAPESSRVLAAPVIDGLVRLNGDATRMLQPGDVLAGYRLIRELGRGGMSVVWLAERADGVVKRAVALKMPMFMLQDAGDVQRFARERDALAALTHPNVARLYDAGVLPSGQPFIVLEHVDGLPLTVHCDAQRLDLRARLRLFLQVLGAVEHAHKHLIVHRDLKPANILVDGERQVKLLDFGIAKLLGESDAAAPLTELAGAAMTPLYAAPEQLRGATISTLTDVYSLGLVLHELLTGILPYRGAGTRANLVEILESLGRGTLPRASHAAIEDAAAIARGRPTSARLRGELSGDLDTIIGKALRIAPDERYGSAAHLADDLKRYLDQKPIAARPPSFWYSTRLAITRHRMAAGVAGVGLTLVAGASLVAWSQYRESRAHEERVVAVRNFMIDMFNDAEAVDGHEGDVTGRQMVDAAVRRAREEFQSQPQLQAELLVELGRMYVRLGAPDAAIPVLGESIAVLERVARAADPALNKSRVYLAGALLETGEDLSRVTALATAARTSCAGADVECVKARAYAGNLLSQLASFAGDDELALTEMRSSVQETQRAFGTVHEESVASLTSLAVIARNAGHLKEAGDAVGSAHAIAPRVRLRAADRAQLERTMAVIDHDLGHYAAARDRLRELIAATQVASERALQWRILANVYADMGDGANALTAADQAMSLLPSEGQAQRMPFVLQARARGLAASGRVPEAIVEIEGVIASLARIGRAPESFEVLRARRYRAEYLGMAGRGPEALSELRELKVQHARAPVSSTEQGLALDALGEAERRDGNAQAARAAHEAARTSLVEELPEGHPYLMRNASLAGSAASSLNRVVMQ